MTKPGLDVLTYYPLCRCAPLCPNHEPRLAGDPGKNLKRLSSCSEQTPETAFYAGKRSLVCGCAEQFWNIPEFFCVDWAGLRNGAWDGAEFALHMDLEQGG